MKTFSILLLVMCGCNTVHIDQLENVESGHNVNLAKNVEPISFSIRNSVEQKLISSIGSKGQDHYTIRKHIQTGYNSLSIVWMTTGGRVGEGLIGVYSKDGKILSSHKYGPLRNVTFFENGSNSYYILVTSVVGSGTGLHQENTAIYKIDNLQATVWERDSKRTEVGPYPNGFHTEREFQFFFNDGNIYIIEVAMTQKLGDDQTWQNPEYKTSLFLLDKDGDKFRELSGSTTNRLLLEIIH